MKSTSQVHRHRSLNSLQSSLIVAGTRDMTDIEWVYESLDNWVRANERPFEVIHGGATGADTFAGQWAQEESISIRVFLPDWNQHGKAAGPIRNTQMAQEATHLLAFWNYNSRGTRNMISAAFKYRLSVWVYPDHCPE